MNGGYHGCFDQARITQGKKIEIIVDNIILVGLFHQMTDMKALSYFGIDFRVFGIGLLTD